MISILNKNSVLVGTMNCFCLVCECYLQSPEVACSHIENQLHKQNMSKVSYMKDYEAEHILKVVFGYFCEFCNIVLATILKLKLHLAENSHFYNKGIRLLKYVENSIVAYDSIHMSQESWNGFVGNTCVICNAEFDDKNVHQADRMHAFNLVQSKLIFNIHNKIFRKVDESYIQCLFCNTICASSFMENHLECQLYRDTADDVNLVQDIEVANGDAKDMNNLENDNITNSRNTSESDVTNSKSSDELKQMKKVDATNDTHSNDLDEVKETDSTNSNNINQFKEVDDKTVDRPISPKVLNNDKDTHDKKNNKKNKNKSDSAGDEKLDIFNVNSTEPISLGTEQDKNQVGDLQPFNSVTHLDNEDITDHMSYIQANEINLNFISNTATCKKCNKDVDFKLLAIKQHIEKHKQKNFKQETPDSNNLKLAQTSVEHSARIEPMLVKPVKAQTSEHVSPSDSVKCFAEQNHMRLYRRSKADCRICNKSVTANLKCMKHHTEGNEHKSNLLNYNALKAKKNIGYVPFKDFVSTMAIVRNNEMTREDMILNESFCIDNHSFAFFMVMNKTVRCLVCEVTMQRDEAFQHVHLEEHKDIVKDAIVITSIPTEFIRQWKAELYHCGYCNEVVEGWDELVYHLGSFTHQKVKQYFNWLKVQYLREDLTRVRKSATLRDMVDNYAFDIKLLKKYMTDKS